MGQKKLTRFTELQRQAGLSFDEAIALIKVSRSTGFRYQAGTSAPSGAAIKLLEQAAAKRTTFTPGWFRFIDLFAGIGGLRKGFEQHRRPMRLHVRVGPEQPEDLRKQFSRQPPDRR